VLLDGAPSAYMSRTNEKWHFYESELERKWFQFRLRYHPTIQLEAMRK